MAKSGKVVVKVELTVSGPALGDICRAILSDLEKLHAAGIPDPDALSCLGYYYDNPEEPGSDGIRAKSVLEKK